MLWSTLTVVQNHVSVASNTAILTSASHLTLQTCSDRSLFGHHQSYIVVVTSVTSLQTQLLQTLPAGCNLKPETAHNQRAVVLLLDVEPTLLLLLLLPLLPEPSGSSGEATPDR